jgi:ABC-type phosphate transport system ATPase subunit
MLLGKVIGHTATEDMLVTPGKQQTANHIDGRYC